MHFAKATAKITIVNTIKSAATNSKPENGFVNIFFNIVIPVLILNKGSRLLDPLTALIIALAFPLGYGIYDAVKRRKINAFSVLGLLNVGVTGGFALVGLSGGWFAIKEAAFPLLVGAFVLGSAFTKKPFIETLLMNPTIMNIDLIQQRLRELNNEIAFKEHIKKATIWLSASFLLSAILNFVLARRIFVNLDPLLPPAEKSIILNEQIAQMTTWSMAVIMVPSILFLLGIFWYLLKGIQNYSNLKTDDILIQK